MRRTSPTLNLKENNMKRIMRATVSAVAVGTMLVVGGPVTTSMAAPPTVEVDNGAYVRLLGNPTAGTAKFQFGWYASTPASDAAGYWIGLYDVTNSRYVWVSDTGPVALPDALFINARPTPDLPNGDYKVVLFVRATYDEPVTNIAEIELPFTVNRL
jgi:hypothetical protein